VGLLTFITRGNARITGEGLRCAAPRGGDNDDGRRVCHKLLAKKNADGQIAGNFRCERCKQEVEVKLAPARDMR
jgi:hypothetical protein